MIKKCVLPVAGLGTRFLPFTKVIPKELLPIYSKPLIEYAIDEAVQSEILDFVVVINKNKEAIVDYLSPNNNLDQIVRSTHKENLLTEINKIINKCSFSYIYQETMSGLGDAISYGKKNVNSEPFAVILPDDLCHSNAKSVLAQMIDIHLLYPDHSIVAVEEVDNKEVEKYGVIEGEIVDKAKQIYHVRSMVEKPSSNEAPSNLAIIGRYILQPEIFNALENIDADKNGEKQITDALKILASKNKVLALKFSGTRLDCGSIDGFIEANNFFKQIYK